MPIKDILVHLDSGSRSAVRLGLAAALARRHGARLVGLFAQTAEPHRVGVVAVWPPEAYRRAADASRAAFLAATADVSGAEWQDANRGSEAEVLRAVSESGRNYDLVVLGQAYEDERLVPDDLVEHSIQESGRPVLVVPFAGHVESLGQRPLFAWNGSRESARALNDALPLLAQDAAAMVLSIGSTTQPPEASSEAILAHLACHGVRASSERLVAGDVGLMDLVLNRAADHGSDLLVLGAFGSHGAALLGRGAGTRYLLRHMTVPILMAH
jgi:nucleotide-binding universal stress UspA family protein